MSVQDVIEQKLVDAIPLAGLEVINESHMHNVPPGSESHFKVVIISEEFEGERLVKRHQRVNAVLADELAGPVHALAMQTLTPEEWTAKGGQTMPSPECLGGGRG
ncbi:MAG: BolA/IbaG family iron-sulfur metabolism protein [Rhodospirillaceae bacterium]|jgi:BolA family transcriptional regulator, general stress-responsive regulator|nr:BolA/IbaG family iron-sulfur metabolism protein [Rhodospirillaceae bacterium]MBT7265749.1 BolA/IbaG family iron-sulfur metabolism protein [Rhodospirillaceae bacterium]